MAAAGEVAAAIFNTNRQEASDPVLSAVDFIPKSLAELMRPKSEEPAEELTGEALAAFLGARETAPKPMLEPEK